MTEWIDVPVADVQTGDEVKVDGYGKPVPAGEAYSFSGLEYYSLRVADDQLQRMSPRGGWALSRVAWPNAAPEAYDMVAPVLYGIHDSTGMQQGPGLVPTIYIDTVQFRYLVCAGRAKSIDYVYVDGVQTGRSRRT